MVCGGLRGVCGSCDCFLLLWFVVLQIRRHFWSLEVISLKFFYVGSQ